MIRNECPVGLRDAQRFGLRSARLRGAEEAAVHARGVYAVATEDTGAVRVGERHHDQVTRLDRAYLGPDGVHDADRLVSHGPAAGDGLHQVVGPEIAAADAGAGDPEEGVGGLDDAGVGDGLDPDVAGLVHDGCAHFSSWRGSECAPFRCRSRAQR
jgi:hypothetical protein